MPSLPEPSYEELKEENRMLRNAICKLMRMEIPTEEEMIQHMQNADFSVSLRDVINELNQADGKSR